MRERLHEEISNDYRDMIYAATRGEVETQRKAFIRKWRLKCRAVADSLEEAGDKLFTFTRFPPSQWKSIRTSNAIERLHEEFKRRIKTQTVLPCAETAAMLFWALPPRVRSPCARSTDGRPSPRNPSIRSLTSPHDWITSCRPKTRQINSNTSRDGTDERQHEQKREHPDERPSGIEQQPYPVHACSSLAQQRQSAVDRADGAIEQCVALGAGDPRPPHPHKNVRDDGDHREDDEAGDEQGMELLRLRFTDRDDLSSLVAIS